MRGIRPPGFLFKLNLLVEHGVAASSPQSVYLSRSYYFITQEPRNLLETPSTSRHCGTGVPELNVCLVDVTFEDWYDGRLEP